MAKHLEQGHPPNTLYDCPACEEECLHEHGRDDPANAWCVAFAVREPHPTCPVCTGKVEITPSGALVCREYGSAHMRHEAGTYGINGTHIVLRPLGREGNSTQPSTLNGSTGNRGLRSRGPACPVRLRRDGVGYQTVPRRGCGQTGRTRRPTREVASALPGRPGERDKHDGRGDHIRGACSGWLRVPGRSSVPSPAGGRRTGRREGRTWVRPHMAVVWRKISPRPVPGLWGRPPCMAGYTRWDDWRHLHCRHRAGAVSDVFAVVGSRG